MKEMKATQTNAIKRIIKNATNSALKGVFIDVDGSACACDGFRVVRLYGRPDGLPTAPGLNTSRFFDKWEPGAGLLLPSVECLKYHIKNKMLYDFGNGMPHVDARYLLDMIRIFPDAAAYMGAKGVNDAIMFYSEYGDGLLLPCRKEAKQ